MADFSSFLFIASAMPLDEAVTSPKTWVYILSVVPIVECPSSALILAISMPSALRIDANVCLKCRALHFRHTFATRCIEAGVPPVVLKKWLGHSDIHVTLDTYTDIFSEMSNDSIELLNEHLKSL